MNQTIWCKTETHSRITVKIKQELNTVTGNKAYNPLIKSKQAPRTSPNTEIKTNKLQQKPKLIYNHLEIKTPRQQKLWQQPIFLYLNTVCKKKKKKLNECYREALCYFLVSSGSFWPAMNLSSDIIKSRNRTLRIHTSGTHLPPSSTGCMLWSHH